MCMLHVLILLCIAGALLLQHVRRVALLAFRIYASHRLKAVTLSYPSTNPQYYGWWQQTNSRYPMLVAVMKIPRPLKYTITAEYYEGVSGAQAFQVIRTSQLP